MTVLLQEEVVPGERKHPVNSFGDLSWVRH